MKSYTVLLTAVIEVPDNTDFDLVHAGLESALGFDYSFDLPNEETASFELKRVMQIPSADEDKQGESFGFTCHECGEMIPNGLAEHNYSHDETCSLSPADEDSDDSDENEVITVPHEVYEQITAPYID